MNNNKVNKVFMAFATGSESTEGTSIKRYTGVGSVFVLAVNPNKAKLEEYYNTTLDNEPEYLGKAEVGPEGSKREVDQVRIDFIVMTDAEKNNGIDLTTKVSFFLKNAGRYNKDMTKLQIIDKYGQTAWATVEEAKAKAIPQYSSGPANIDPDYRPAYVGEEELTAFIKAYLNIPNKSFKKKTGEIVEIKNPADAEARLDGIPDYFKGNFKELETVIGLQPKNKVKVLFGVKTTSENKQYQAVYSQRFLKNNINDYSRLDQELQERKEAGAYPDTEFTVGPLKEYVVNATDFGTANSVPSGEDLPFGDGSDAPANNPWFPG